MHILATKTLTAFISSTERTSDQRLILRNTRNRFSAVVHIQDETAEVVKILKEKNHKALPIFLQKLESHVFIDLICKKLVEEGIIPITIHDSVIVQKKHEDILLKSMIENYQDEMGVNYWDVVIEVK